MNKILLLSSVLLLFTMCSNSSQCNDPVSADSKVVQVKVRTGAERTADYLPLLQGKRVALLVNQTSRIGERHLVDSLLQLGVELKKIFAPEHGFRGKQSDGATIHDEVDAATGLPIFSIYGKHKKPSPSMLADVDVVLFDIQDVGVRFYTFISNMHYLMEACAEQGKSFIVLDRPNPNGFYIDGPVLDIKYQSFIGMHPIPMVHGLTVGELAQMINGEHWLKDGIECDLTVIPCEHYNHQTLYQLPIPPSPNLPNMNAVYLYPSLGLLEATTVSTGRGTSTPFQIAGRPGFMGTMRFTPHVIPGVSETPKFRDQLCGGIVLPDVKDSSLFADPCLNLDYLLLFYQSHNPVEQGVFFRDIFDKFVGNDQLQKQLEQGLTADEIRESWKGDLEEYKAMRKKYLLYP